MLAAHRDQENLVLNRQPKTPGARYPHKTPTRFPQNDENAPTVFAGKTGLGGARAMGGQDKTAMKQKQSLITPMDNRTRAPLGNKTTNAKAKSSQVAGVKDIVREMEKAQPKPTTTQKPKQKSGDVIFGDLKVSPKNETRGEEEPEYAPPKPKDLPYESDIFPKGLISLEGLKKENLFKGYYEHFYNPIDDTGVTQQEKTMQQTMKKVMTKAEERNKRETDAIGWNLSDLPQETQKKVLADKTNSVRSSSTTRGAKPSLKQSTTISSRQAASALSLQSDTAKNRGLQLRSRPATSKRPLSGLFQGQRSVKKEPLVGKSSALESASGEAASRTTIGYNRGRTASSMMQAQARSSAGAPGRGERVQKPASVEEPLANPTVTPVRLRQAGGQKSEKQDRPQFMSIFDDDDDNDDDLAPVSAPLALSDDEEDFELKLDF